MAHYAGVISLKNTLLRLLDSRPTPSTYPVREILEREILESTYGDVLSLQNVLKRWDEDRSSSELMRDLHRQITEAVCKLEDLLESDASNHSPSKFESNNRSYRAQDDTESCSMAKMVMKLMKPILDVFRNQDELMLGSDVRDLIMRDEVSSFRRTMKKMETEYVEELANPVAEVEDDTDEDVDEDADGFGKDFGAFKKVYWDVMSQVYNADKRIRIIKITGMAGIGKTTLAKRILSLSTHLKFECHAFVKMGQKYSLREICRDIVSQVNPSLDKTLLEADDEIIAECLWQSLDGKRYFILLDDVWDDYANLTRMLPNIGSQGRVLITTRIRRFGSNNFIMQLLNEEEGWLHFQRKMFGLLSCPLQLKEAGKKIAKRCDGHPLLIATIAKLLSRVDKTPEYWGKVATEKRSSVFIEAYNRISKVMYPSFNYLSRQSKACFLYMGAFPHDHEVRRSRLINLWMAEGFLEINQPYRTLQESSVGCFKELVNSNVVVATD